MKTKNSFCRRNSRQEKQISRKKDSGSTHYIWAIIMDSMKARQQNKHENRWEIETNSKQQLCLYAVDELCIRTNDFMREALPSFVDVVFVLDSGGGGGGNDGNDVVVFGNWRKYSMSHKINVIFFFVPFLVSLPIHARSLLRRMVEARAKERDWKK